MNEFDPIKAAREELAGMNEMHKACLKRVRETEQQFAEIESQHDAALKLEAMANEWVKRMQANLRTLEAEAEEKAKREAEEKAKRDTSG